MEWNLVAYPERCLELIQEPHSQATMCQLNYRCCILITRGSCPTYEDWMFEQRQGEVDQVGNYRKYGLVPAWLQEFEKEAGYNMGT